MKINVLGYSKIAILCAISGCLTTFACAQNQSPDTLEDFIARFKDVEETWPFTLKNALVQFQENEFEVYFEKFKLDSIQTDGSPLAVGTALGRVPFVKELIISAHFQQIENPAIRHIVRFPCLKVYDGKWKLWSRIETTKSY